MYCHVAPQGLLRCASLAVHTLNKTRRSKAVINTGRSTPVLGAAGAAGKQAELALDLKGCAFQNGKVIYYLHNTQVNTKLRSVMGIKEKKQSYQSSEQGRKLIAEAITVSDCVRARTNMQFLLTPQDVGSVKHMEYI